VRPPGGAIEGAHVVVSATKFVTPPEPSLERAWLAPGALALPIDVASAWEPAAYLGADKFIIDRWDILRVVAESGHFPAGLPRLYAELHEAVESRKPGRESDAESIFVMFHTGVLVSPYPSATRARGNAACSFG
jgi:ornithine cyclodeaminase/alanine dehydrogenase-like protein (mu-crystallin family)